MALGHTWAGHSVGTHPGNLFVKLEGEDKSLTGILRHCAEGAGTVVYKLTGSFDGTKLVFEGGAEAKGDALVIAQVTASATLQPDGTLRGEWESAEGDGGIFVLYPHNDGSKTSPEPAQPSQLHTSRHQFGPVVVERDSIITIAEDIQKELPRSRVIVTFDTGTEQSVYLSEFRTLKFHAERATFIKVYGREPDSSGLDRILAVEFGQGVNFALAQSSNRSWALGAADHLRRQLSKFERSYANKQYGNVFTQLMLAGTIAAVPSLDTFQERIVLMVTAVLVSQAIAWAHDRYLPNAAIYLGERSEGTAHSIFQSVGMWVINAIGTVIVTLVGLALKGLLHL